MSLSSKILLILAAVVTFYAVADDLVQSRILEPRFAALEEREAKQDVLRVRRAFEREIEELSARCRDWARWDDTCAFLETGDPEFVAANLGDRQLDEANVHLLYFCDAEGNVVWHRVWDPDRGETRVLREFPTGRLGRGHPLMKFGAGDLGQQISGLTMVDGEPMLICSQQVTTSDFEGPARGVVVLGRFLSSQTVAAIRDRTGVDFDHWRLNGPDLPDREAAVLDQVTARSPFNPLTVPRDDELLVAYTTVDDILMQDPLLVRANIPRDIYAQGNKALNYAFLSTIAAGLLLLLVLMTVLQRTVLAPIGQLTRHALAVGRTDDTTARLRSERKDEIGILAREFDDMLEKLSLSRAAVIQTARAAGMSEIATGVLHNVGNVLNSVNVSAALVARKVGELDVGDLERIVRVLDEHEGDLADFVSSDPKGRHLHPFLKSLASKLSHEHGELDREVQSLNRGIDHVKVLIKAQQTFARPTEVREPTDLREQIESALEMSYQVLARNPRLVVERRYEELPTVLVDRHKLMEILINLILNARQSMLRADRDRMELGLEVASLPEERLRITVRDNGVGIPPANLDRIFNHGFTTRRDGHGFGLHTAANAAGEMGGSLRADSEGQDRGAVFVLELPMRRAGAPAEDPAEDPANASVRAPVTS